MKKVKKNIPLQNEKWDNRSLKETITAVNSIRTVAKLKVKYLICISPIAKTTGRCIIDNYVTTLAAMKL